MKEIFIPGSKSQSIRALLVNAFSCGVAKIDNILFSSDTLSCIKALEKLNVVFKEEDGALIIDSRNIFENVPDDTVLDLENSGTSLYLLMGLVASSGKRIILTGDESLKKRPVKEIADALSALGAEIEMADDHLPLAIKGPLKGGYVEISCPSSQYLSSLLLASVFSLNDTEIKATLLYEKPYVTLTLSWLDKEHIDYTISSNYMRAKIKGRQHFFPLDSYISGDYSSACFFFAYAMVKKESIYVRGLDPYDEQGDKRVLSILEEMGASVKEMSDGFIIKGPDRIKGGTFDLNDIPDSLPVLAVLSALSSEEVRLINCANARIKETDRIKAMHDELEKIGVSATELADGLVIHPSRIKGGLVRGYDDHRIIMAFSILKTVVPSIEIDSTEKVSVTLPRFFDMLAFLEESDE